MRFIFQLRPSSVLQCLDPIVKKVSNNRYDIIVWTFQLMNFSAHTSIYTYYRAIGLMSRVFANGPGDQGSIPGRVIPKTQKTVLDAALLNIQHYKVRSKGKVEQSREWSNVLSYTCVVAIEKGAFGSPMTKVANFTFTYISIYCE